MRDQEDIRVIEVGDLKITRPEPVDIPKDWESIYFSIDADIRNKNRTGKWLQLVPQTEAQESCLRVLKSEDVFTYFETIVSNSEYFDAMVNFAPYAFREIGAPGAPNRRWGALMFNFKRWWIHTRYDVDRNTYDSMCILYGFFTDRAKFNFALDRDIIRAYSIMAEEMMGKGVNV